MKTTLLAIVLSALASVSHAKSHSTEWLKMEEVDPMNDMMTTVVGKASNEATFTMLFMCHAEGRAQFGISMNNPADWGSTASEPFQYRVDKQPPVTLVMDREGPSTLSIFEADASVDFAKALSEASVLSVRIGTATDTFDFSEAPEHLALFLDGCPVVDPQVAGN